MSPTPSAITTHVLDISTGRPAAGVAVSLETGAGNGWQAVARGVTDADGRCRDLGPAAVPTGRYRLTFATGAWFAAGGRESLHPEVSVTVEIRDPGHHHIPLLVAPFGYSTYRGS